MSHCSSGGRSGGVPNLEIYLHLQLPQLLRSPQLSASEVPSSWRFLYQLQPFNTVLYIKSTHECHYRDFERAQRQCEGQHLLDGQRHSDQSIQCQRHPRCQYVGLYTLPCPNSGLTFIYHHPQMMSVRQSRAGSLLSTFKPLKTNSYKNEEREPESGSSNLGNSRSGVMEHLKFYGAQEMVRLSLSLDRTSSLVNGQPVPERLSLRKSLIELRVGSWLIVGIHSRSIVVNHLRTLSAENDSVATTFIYCNYKEQAEQTVSNLVASLLRQIVQGRRAISDDVKSFFERHQRQTSRPTLDQLQDVLISEIRTRSKVFIVVDAWDECREDDETRTLLLEVLRSLPRQANLMVTSRNLPSIGRDFKGAKRLHIRAKDDDMRAYIEGRIASGPRHLKNLQEAIVNKIVENAKGM